MDNIKDKAKAVLVKVGVAAGLSAVQSAVWTFVSQKVKKMTDEKQPEQK